MSTRYAAVGKNFRCLQIGCVPVMLVGLAVGIGVVLTRHIANSDYENSARFQALPRDAPQARQTEINNELIIALRLVADLDGKVVRYPEELVELVARDGSWRTDLPLEEMAKALRINPRAIAKTDAPNEIDPAATLFKVATGVLSAKSRALLRKERMTNRRDNRPKELLVDEFIRQDICFSLNSMKQPDNDSKMILAAISRAVREVMPQPGEKARAIVISREAIESGDVDFFPGYLPLEPNTNATVISGDE